MKNIRKHNDKNNGFCPIFKTITNYRFLSQTINLFCIALFVNNLILSLSRTKTAGRMCEVGPSRKRDVPIHLPLFAPSVLNGHPALRGLRLAPLIKDEYANGSNGTNAR